jgi:hypothetical protein
MIYGQVHPGIARAGSGRCQLQLELQRRPEHPAWAATPLKIMTFGPMQSFGHTPP